MYKFKDRVRYSELDRKGKLSLQGVINYLQDCSTFQSEALGRGMEYLKGQRRGWWIASWQLEIMDRPGIGEEITVGTFPYDFKGFFGMRNFFIQNSAGEYLVKANSIWIHVNTDTGHPVKVTQEEAEVYGKEACLEMDYYGRKIEVPNYLTAKAEEPFPVRRYHIDTNQHMNNSYYPAIAMEYLPEDFQCGKLQIEYKTAAVLGEIIYPFVLAEENQYWVILADQKGKPYAVVYAR